MDIYNWSLFIIICIIYIIENKYMIELVWEEMEAKLIGGKAAPYGVDICDSCVVYMSRIWTYLH